jgi:hypothetical protein
MFFVFCFFFNLLSRGSIEAASRDLSVTAGLRDEETEATDTKLNILEQDTV